MGGLGEALLSSVKGDSLQSDACTELAPHARATLGEGQSFFIVHAVDSDTLRVVLLRFRQLPFLLCPWLSGLRGPAKSLGRHRQIPRSRRSRSLRCCSLPDHAGRWPEVSLLPT